MQVPRNQPHQSLFMASCHSLRPDHIATRSMIPDKGVLLVTAYLKGHVMWMQVLIKKKYALTGWQLFEALMWREVILVKRNLFLYTFRFVQLIFVALITGTLFLRTRLRPDNINDGSLYEAVIFFSLIQLMFDGFVEMNLTVR